MDIKIENGEVYLQAGRDLVNLLWKKGLIKRDYPQGLKTLSPVRIRILPENRDPSKVEEWIDEWRRIFPKGRNNINHRFRGDRKECLKKMQNFLVDYGFSKEKIIKATQMAVDEYSQTGFNYFPKAQFFIHKQEKGSLLAEYCELLDEQEDEGFGDNVGADV